MLVSRVHGGWSVGNFQYQAMHDPFGDDEQFARLDCAGRFSLDIHFHVTLEDVEEIIGHVMLMERVFADIIRQARSLGGRYIGRMMFLVLPFFE